jgi:signal peptidase
MRRYYTGPQEPVVDARQYTEPQEPVDMRRYYTGSQEPVVDARQYTRSPEPADARRPYAEVQEPPIDAWRRQTESQEPVGAHPADIHNYYNGSSAPYVSSAPYFSANQSPPPYVRGPEDAELDYEAALDAHRLMTNPAKHLRDDADQIQRADKRSLKIARLATQRSKDLPLKRKKTAAMYISDFMFYAALVLVLFITIQFTSNAKDGPIILLNHSILTVLTPSMQSVIPKGSLVIIRTVDPDTLQIGDDITYMKDQKTSITHRVIQIIENYNNTGAKGFQTKGVNNQDPDTDIVYAGNVVGRVVFHMPVLGAALGYLSQNIYIVFILFALLMLLSFSIRSLLKRDSKTRAKRGGSAVKDSGKRRQAKGKSRVSVYNGSKGKGGQFSFGHSSKVR